MYTRPSPSCVAHVLPYSYSATRSLKLHTHYTYYVLNYSSTEYVCTGYSTCAHVGSTVGYPFSTCPYSTCTCHVHTCTLITHSLTFCTILLPSVVVVETVIIRVIVPSTRLHRSHTYVLLRFRDIFHVFFVQFQYITNALAHFFKDNTEIFKSSFAKCICTFSVLRSLQIGVPIGIDHFICR